MKEKLFLKFAGDVVENVSVMNKRATDSVTKLCLESTLQSGRTRSVASNRVLTM